MIICLRKKRIVEILGWSYSIINKQCEKQFKEKPITKKGLVISLDI